MMRIMLYRPGTGIPIGRFSWPEIMDLIGDDIDVLRQALEYYERDDGMELSRLLALHSACAARDDTR